MLIKKNIRDFFKKCSISAKIHIDKNRRYDKKLSDRILKYQKKTA